MIVLTSMENQSLLYSILEHQDHNSAKFAVPLYQLPIVRDDVGAAIEGNKE